MFDLDGKKTIVNATAIQRDFAGIVEKTHTRDVIIIRNNEPIAALISLERLARLEANAAVATLPVSVQHFVEGIQAAPEEFRQQIIAVVLFGSYARSTQHADSDIDLLVITRSSSRQIQDTISLLSHDAMAASDYNDFLVTMPMTEAHWKKLRDCKSLLVEEIQRDGKILWKTSSFKLND